LKGVDVFASGKWSGLLCKREKPERPRKGRKISQRENLPKPERPRKGLQIFTRENLPKTQSPHMEQKGSTRVSFLTKIRVLYAPITGYRNAKQFEKIK
jgi:hypothetical protein